MRGADASGRALAPVHEEAAAIDVRALKADDLAAYRALREGMLDTFPDAFTSDAAAERARDSASLLARFGDPERFEPGTTFTLGAWRAGELIGAISCERASRLKVRHTGHVIGMMVSPAAQGLGAGRALLDDCIARVRLTPGVEMLILTVTTGNGPATRLYESAGFIRYGTQPRAMKIGERYLDKDQMALML